MGRHEQRELVFRLLFRMEFHPPEDMAEQAVLFFEDEEQAGVSEKDRSYVVERFEKIKEKTAELDRLIDDKTEGWDTVRMGRVEVAVLRLGVYEICFDDDVPGGVAINEAVELAKQYGQGTSGGFVNAILAKFV